MFGVVFGDMLLPQGKESRGGEKLERRCAGNFRCFFPAICFFSIFSDLGMSPWSGRINPPPFTPRCLHDDLLPSIGDGIAADRRILSSDLSSHGPHGSHAMSISTNESHY